MNDKQRYKLAILMILFAILMLPISLYLWVVFIKWAVTL